MTKQELLHHRDNLTIMIWWLKGYKAGSDGDFEKCPFQEDHIKTLKFAMETINETMEGYQA